MSILFEPMKIRNLELRNRFVRSATYDKFSDEKGHVTDKRIKFFANLADGGVGLIVTGLTFVHPSGQLAAFESSMATDDCIPGLKRLSATVHDRGAKAQYGWAKSNINILTDDSPPYNRELGGVSLRRIGRKVCKLDICS